MQAKTQTSKKSNPLERPNQLKAHMIVFVFLFVIFLNIGESLLFWCELVNFLLHSLHEEGYMTKLLVGAIWCEHTSL